MSPKWLQVLMICLFETQFQWVNLIRFDNGISGREGVQYLYNGADTS
jgi:hypothetical protein